MLCLHFAVMPIPFLIEIRSSVRFPIVQCCQIIPLVPLVTIPSGRSRYLVCARSNHHYVIFPQQCFMESRHCLAAASVIFGQAGQVPSAEDSKLSHFIVSCSGFEFKALILTSHSVGTSPLYWPGGVVKCCKALLHQAERREAGRGPTELVHQYMSTGRVRLAQRLGESGR